MLFANFAEAMAEGRGKAQADTLRRAKTETTANLIKDDGSTDAPDFAAHLGDVVYVAAGEFIPGDGEVIEGVASVDESAITGESAPVIRESGGDRSAVTGGTKVLSDWIKVRITSNPGETLHRSNDRTGRRCITTENTERDRAQYSCSPGLDDHFFARGRHPAALRDLFESSADIFRVDLAPRLPDTNDDRWPLLSAIGIAGMDRLIQHNVLACRAEPSRPPAT